MTIDDGMECTSQLDIRKSNNAAMEMAIADFFHCESIPDQAAKSSCFRGMIKLACLVGKDFVVPNRKKMEVRIFLFCFLLSKSWKLIF